MPPSCAPRPQVAANADAYITLADGTTLDARLRRLAGEAIDGGAVTDSLFSTSGTREFYAWLNQPATRGAEAGLTRYHETIWEDRLDLLHAPTRTSSGPDAEGLAGWMWRYAPEQLPMPAELLPPKPSHLRGPLRAGESDPLWGVNVAGFFRSELGIGEAARLLIAGLDAAHVPALPVQGALIPGSRQGAEFTFASPVDAPYPINIICMNADTVLVFARDAGEQFFKDRHTIALWWWELGEFPETVAGGIRARRRDLGRVGADPRRHRTDRTGPRGEGSAAGHAPAAHSLHARGARPPRRVRVPVHVRLPLHRRAQESGRSDRGVHQGVPAGQRRVTRAEDDQLRERARGARAGPRRRCRASRHSFHQRLRLRGAQGRAGRGL